MAARRGLNRSRGLESLIPNKLKEEQEAAPEKETEEKNAKEPENHAVKKTAAKRTGETGKRPGKGSGRTSAVEESAGVSEIPDDRKISLLKTSDIIPNHNQPRKKFDEEAIEELAGSIKEHGVLQPLLVQRKGKYYEIVAGERRWRAAKKAGLREVPAVVRAFSAEEATEISLIENIQRENLNAIEEAEAYRALIEDFRLTQDEVAEKVGKSRSSVTNSLRLLKLAPEVREMLTDGKISMGHARALLAITDKKKQTEAAVQAAEKGLSVRETEKLAKKTAHAGRNKAGDDSSDRKQDEALVLAYRHLEEMMTGSIGSKVTIHPHGTGGKIEIEYYSADDLERIAESFDRADKA